MIQQTKHRYNVRHKSYIEYVTYDELISAYKDCIKSKKSKISYQEYLINAQTDLYHLYWELNKKTYQIHPSTTFIVTHPKPREIFAAQFRDRIVHHLLINRIYNYYEQEIITNSFACRKNKGTLFGVQTAKKELEIASENYAKNGYIYKGDFKSFFITIDKRILFDKLCVFIDKYMTNKIDNEYTKWLCKLIVFNCPQQDCIFKMDKSRWHIIPKDKSLFSCDEYHGLPVGNITSQLFANLYMSDFDKFVINKLHVKYYGRYVDDFYMYVDTLDELNYIKTEINKYLKNINIILHPKKCYIYPYYYGFSFLGSVIKPNRIYIARKTYGTLYKRINRANKIYEQNSYITKKDKQYILCMMNSYYGFMKYANTYKQKLKIFDSDLFKLHFRQYFRLTQKRNKIYIPNEKYPELYYNSRSATVKPKFKNKYFCTQQYIDLIRQKTKAPPKNLTGNPGSSAIEPTLT